MKRSIRYITFLSLTFVIITQTKAQALLDFETGAVIIGYNEVRIPGDAGTFFSLKDDLTTKTDFFYRIRLNYTIKSRHTLSLLYAPLETKSEGSVPKDIVFEGVKFPANSQLEGI